MSKRQRKTETESAKPEAKEAEAKAMEVDFTNVTHGKPAKNCVSGPLLDRALENYFTDPTLSKLAECFRATTDFQTALDTLARCMLIVDQHVGVLYSDTKRGNDADDWFAVRCGIHASFKRFCTPITSEQFAVLRKDDEFRNRVSEYNIGSTWVPKMYTLGKAGSSGFYSVATTPDGTNVPWYQSSPEVMLIDWYLWCGHRCADNQFESFHQCLTRLGLVSTGHIKLAFLLYFLRYHLFKSRGRWQKDREQAPTHGAAHRWIPAYTETYWSGGLAVESLLTLSQVQIISKEIITCGDIYDTHPLTHGSPDAVSDYGRWLHYRNQGMWKLFDVLSWFNDAAPLALKIQPMYGELGSMDVVSEANRSEECCFCDRRSVAAGATVRWLVYGGQPITRMTWYSCFSSDHLYKNRIWRDEFVCKICLEKVVAPWHNKTPVQLAQKRDELVQPLLEEMAEALSRFSLDLVRLALSFLCAPVVKEIVWVT